MSHIQRTCCSICYHTHHACPCVQAAADRGELLLWRHQRLAVALAAWATVAALSQALGVASVPLLG